MEAKEKIEKINKVLEMVNSDAFESDEQKLKLYDILDDGKGLKNDIWRKS